jgi:arylsulfatase A-like enzyme
MVEIKRGDRDVTELDQLTLDVRRDCDTEYLRRASAFTRAQATADVPFFVYFNHSLMHMPVIPRAEFKGQTSHGDWADSLLELDTDFGSLLDLLDELDLGANTMVVFAGDNGPEEVLLWRGTPGYWEGSYFAGGEGNLRTPLHRALARPHSRRTGQRRHHARHRLVHHAIACGAGRSALGPGD